jgi:hypothetical protein
LRDLFVFYGKKNEVGRTVTESSKMFEVLKSLKITGCSASWRKASPFAAPRAIFRRVNHGKVAKYSEKWTKKNILVTHYKPQNSMIKKTSNILVYEIDYTHRIDTGYIISPGWLIRHGSRMRRNWIINMAFCVYVIWEQLRLLFGEVEPRIQYSLSTLICNFCCFGRMDFCVVGTYPTEKNIASILN